MINTIRYIIPPVSGLLSPVFSINIFLLTIYFIKPQVISSLVYSDFLMQSTSKYLLIQNYCRASLHSLHTLHAANYPVALFPIEGNIFLSDKKVFLCHWNVERRQLDGFQWCNVVVWWPGGVWVTVVLNWLYRCK